MKSIIAIILCVMSSAVYGQVYSLRGGIADEKNQPLASAAAVLLNPSDSTLLYFSISGGNGEFVMSNIKKGTYLLQVSLLGYNTYYLKTVMPVPGEDIGQITMTPKVFNIDEVTINAERIPMRIKKDTIEYDAKAYKVKPDGVAEDLIKKLPGVEVDRAGNIKALGEDVGNVLVDGKEFFGTDPKVATRNLPADAIDKVQLFDRQTDESRFTGIDDGERNPTLNLVLDKDKKNGIFGDVSAGAGSNGRAQAGAKAYRFTQKSQLAAIGMFNNINQLGFSMKDYINFSGGIANFSSDDGHFMIGGDNSFPVNFGQPVYGKGSNGAGGINFSVFNSSNDRFYISYLGNGSERKLSETSSSRNFLPDASWFSDEQKEQMKTDTTHRINLGLRKVIGGKQSIIANGALSFNSTSNPMVSSAVSFLDDVKINNLQRSSDDIASRLSGNADASYLLKINEGKTILKTSGRVAFSGTDSRTRVSNLAEYFSPYRLEEYSQFFNLENTGSSYSGTISITQRLTAKSFIDISMTAGYSEDDLDRKQGEPEGDYAPDPLLSPVFGKSAKFLRPGVTWKRNTEKSNLSLALFSNFGEFTSVLNGDNGVTTRYSVLNPKAIWEYNYRSGRRLMFEYITTVNSPRASQLLPVVNNLNPLSLFYGNRTLKPEYMHNARLTYWLFDQFSFTSLLASINARYITDKINYSRTVNEDLGQVISLLNLKDEWNAGGMVEFATPIKPLGLKVNLTLDESYSRGRSLINGNENINNSLVHRISLTVGNRKKEKWDVEAGSTATVTDSRFSIQKSLNKVFTDVSFFTEARYTPASRFNLMGSADITNYSARSFSSARLVPLINAEANFYLLKNQRIVLTLAGVDLLNRNTGVERISELNTLTERRSFIIGRYFMLSLKYRLNKVGNDKGGIDIQVRGR